MRLMPMLWKFCASKRRRRMPDCSSPRPPRLELGAPASAGANGHDLEVLRQQEAAADAGVLPGTPAANQNADKEAEDKKMQAREEEKKRESAEREAAEQRKRDEAAAKLKEAQEAKLAAAAAKAKAQEDADAAAQRKRDETAAKMKQAQEDKMAQAAAKAQKQQEADAAQAHKKADADAAAQKKPRTKPMPKPAGKKRLTHWRSRRPKPNRPPSPLPKQPLSFLLLKRLANRPHSQGRKTGRPSPPLQSGSNHPSGISYRARKDHR